MQISRNRLVSLPFSELGEDRMLTSREAIKRAADRGGDAFLQKDYRSFACSRRICALRNRFRLR
jgi:hypothetical protein